MRGTPSLPQGAEEHFKMLEQKYNLPEGYLRGMSWVESQYGTLPDRAGSQYRGMFQMGRNERATYGVKNPSDWRQSAEGAAKLGAANRQSLEHSLGRPVSGQELYLAHQQGLGGARSLLQNGNAPAGKVANAGFIRSNHGDPKAPASQFVEKYASKFNSAPGSERDYTGTQFAQKGAPTPPSRPSDLQQPQTMVAQRAVPTPPTRPADLGQTPTSLARNDVPLPPSRPDFQQPREIARNDFGRNIPGGDQQSSGHPGLDEFRRLYALEQKAGAVPGQTQTASLGRNDFGRGIPTSNQGTPGVGRQLEALPQQMQTASLGRNDFGRGIPTSNQGTPSVGQKLDPLPQQTQMANNAPYPGSVLNRINPKDPSGPLLPEAGTRTQIAQNEPQVSAKQYFEQRYAPTQTAQAPQPQQSRGDVQWANRPQYDYGGRGGATPSQNASSQSPSSQMSDDQVLAMLDSMKGKAPQASQQLFGALDNAKNGRPAMMSDPKAMALGPQQDSAPTTQLADNRSSGAPLLGDTNTGGMAAPSAQATAPTPPSRPMSFGGTPVQVAQVHQAQPQGIDAMLSEPQGGGGGIEGMAGGQQMAQMSPEFFDANAFGAGGQGGFGDLGGLFADAFMPDSAQPQYADAGSDFGGDFGGGGFDLGSIFV